MDRKIFLQFRTCHKLDEGPRLIRMLRIGADTVEPPA